MMRSYTQYINIVKVGLTGVFVILRKKHLPVRSGLCVIGQPILRDARILIPTNLRKPVLQIAQEGHLRIVSMKQCLRSKAWCGRKNTARRRRIVGNDLDFSCYRLQLNLML